MIEVPDFARVFDESDIVRVKIETTAESGGSIKHTLYLEDDDVSRE